MDEEFPPRVYFNKLNSDSLNIMMIYWYFPPDYWKFMDFSQKVNFEIFKRFGEEGIDFAFPTQTMFLAGDPNRPLNVGIQNEIKS
jgi:MscS family membrane protein